MKRWKVGIITCLGLFTLTILLSANQDRLFPYVIYSMLLTTVSLLLAVFWTKFNELTSILYLSLITFLSILYSLRIFYHPVDIAGVGATDFHRELSRLLESGRSGSIQLQFYPDAPNSFLYPASYSLISGLSSGDSLVIYPITASLIAALTVYLLTRYVVLDKSKLRLPLIAAIFSIVAPITVHYGVQPRPHSFSAILLFVLFISLFVSIDSNRKSRYFFMFAVIMISLTLTHKLSTVFMLAIFGGLLLSAPMFQPTRYLTLSKVKKLLKIRQSSNHYRSLYILFVFSIVLFLFQMFLLGEPFTRVIRSTQAVLTSLIQGDIPLLSETTGEEQYKTPTAAEPPNRSLIYPFSGVNRVMLFIPPLAGLAWLYLAWKKRNQPYVQALAILSAVLVMLMALSRLDIRPLTIRYYHVTEPLFIVLITSVFFKGFSNNFSLDVHKLTHMAKSIIIISIVLFAMVFSAGIVPDYNNDQRVYLTEGEMEGKSTITMYTSDTIYTDEYMAMAIPRNPELGPDTWQSEWQTTDRGFIDKDLVNNYEHIAIRSDLDVIREDGGDWILTWNPNDIGDEYNKLYDNNHVVSYSDN